MNIEEMLKLDWVQFYEKRSNLKNRIGGVKVGRYFAIAGFGNRWKIYQIFGGFPILDAWIYSLEDGMKIAEYIDEVYKDYLMVWEAPGWEDCDLLGIARLSIKNGDAIYSTLLELSSKYHDKVTYNDFANILVAKMHVRPS